jgi:hypothetical protein
MYVDPMGECVGRLQGTELCQNISTGMSIVLHGTPESEIEARAREFHLEHKIGFIREYGRLPEDHEVIFDEPGGARHLLGSGEWIDASGRAVATYPEYALTGVGKGAQLAMRGAHAGGRSVGGALALSLGDDAAGAITGLNPSTIRVAWTKLSGQARRYVRDIEHQTGRKLHDAQLEALSDAVRERHFTKLSPAAARAHRAEFDRKKQSLIQEWELHTGQVWSRYDADVLSSSGRVIRRAGKAYDAHHVILNEFGGPSEWWNIHPARFPTQHQGGIHRAGSAVREVFVAPGSGS